MLATLEIKIKPKENIFLKRNYGSLFHGYLLSKIDSNYVEKLHNLKLNPYSQYFYFDKKENSYIWKISTLNKEAKEKIIDIMLNDTNETITFDYNRIKIGILSKEITSITNYKNLADKFFLSDETKRFANITFLTPTTYKVNKKFTFFLFETTTYGKISWSHKHYSIINSRNMVALKCKSMFNFYIIS